MAYATMALRANKTDLYASSVCHNALAAAGRAGCCAISVHAIDFLPTDFNILNRAEEGR